MSDTNPYEAPAIPATPAPRRSRPFLAGIVTAICFLAAAVIGIAGYYVGYAHGYHDGNDDRVSEYPINQARP